MNKNFEVGHGSVLQPPLSIEELNMMQGNYNALVKQNQDLQAELLETKRLLDLANKRYLESIGK